jgi:hypothetical protein
MILSLLGVAVSGSAVIAESVITGIGLGAGLYCASRTKQTTAMPKSSKK